MDEPATLKQRMALANMRKALGKPVTGIRDMTKKEASAAIAECQKEIDENGFPRCDNDGNPFDW